MGDKLLTIRETAERLGLAEKTIRNCLGPKAQRDFLIKPKRIGRRVFFSEIEVENFITSLSTEPTKFNER
jgi:predicted DNA-binding transcriptional regulator AlpA